MKLPLQVIHINGFWRPPVACGEDLTSVLAGDLSGQASQMSTLEAVP